MRVHYDFISFSIVIVILFRSLIFGYKSLSHLESFTLIIIDSLITFLSTSPRLSIGQSKYIVSLDSAVYTTITRNRVTKLTGSVNL